MTPVEMRHYQTLLRTKEADLLRALHQREEIHIEAAPDVFDEIQRSVERDLAILHLDRDSLLLREVRAALDRIADGSYGVCLSCEEEINPRRLKAVPWAARCVKCQEEYDRENARESGYDFTAAA